MTMPSNQGRDRPGDLPEAMAGDLRRLYEPGLPVPPEVDRDMLALARQGLKSRSWRRLVFRMAPAAAAAVIALAVVFWYAVPHAHLARGRALALREDVDRNGRVDILDAFTLARRIESSQGPDLRWDVNGDGVVDRQDVDAVAMAAVRLKAG